jgi:hypothetical protein
LTPSFSIVVKDDMANGIEVVGGTVGLYHPLNGVTNPKYNLLYFVTTKFVLFFAKRRRH